MKITMSFLVILIHCTILIYCKPILRFKQAYIGTPKDPTSQPDQIRLKCKERCIENCLQNNKNGQFYNSHTADGGNFLVDNTIEIQCPDVTVPEDWFPGTKRIKFPRNTIPGKHRNMYRNKHFTIAKAHIIESRNSAEILDCFNISWILKGNWSN